MNRSRRRHLLFLRLPCRHPLVEISLTDHVHHAMHLVMSQPAKLGARNLILANRRRREVHVNIQSRNRILLESQRRHEKTVNHIDRSQTDIHLAGRPANTSSPSPHHPSPPDQTYPVPPQLHHPPTDPSASDSSPHTFHPAPDSGSTTQTASPSLPPAPRPAPPDQSAGSPTRGCPSDSIPTNRIAVSTVHTISSRVLPWE